MMFTCNITLICISLLKKIIEELIMQFLNHIPEAREESIKKREE